MHLAHPATSLQALPSNTWKQIIQIQHNITGLKPQLAGGNQLDIYKRGRGFELGKTENKCAARSRDRRIDD